MDKDRIKGKMDEIAGRAKRQVGEWTGDANAQGEGAMEEIKGTAQNAWGKMKDSARNMKRDMERNTDHADRDIKTERKRDAA